MTNQHVKLVAVFLYDFMIKQWLDVAYILIKLF